MGDALADRIVPLQILPGLAKQTCGMFLSGLQPAVLGSVTAAYGALDEITQPAVGRTADQLDRAADVAGAAFGLVLFFAIRYVLKLQAQRRWAHRARERLSPIG
jgi:hypothetical protein